MFSTFFLQILIIITYYAVWRFTYLNLFWYNFK